MENRKLDKKVEIHKKEVDKLKQVESELITMISETGDADLMEKFLDWQNQRIRCNNTYLETLNIMVQN